MADLLLDPLRSGIAAHALAEVVLLALVCGPLSFWVVSFRLSFAAESLAHAMLPGLVIAALAGGALALGATGAAAVAGLLIALAARDAKLGEDTSVAIVVTGMLGLGGLLALTPESPPRLEDLLFGDPLSADTGDLVRAAVLAGLGLAALAALRQPLAAVAFDGPAARALGLRPAVVSAALLVLLAVATAVAAGGLGNLLVLAMLVAPALAVRGHVRSPLAAMAAAAAVAVAAGIAGIYVSFHLELAAGASVALALCAAALVGSLGGSRHRPATVG